MPDGNAERISQRRKTDWHYNPPGSDWKHKGPLPLSFSFMPRTGGVWRHSRRSGLEYRDVGVTAASKGTMSQRHIRAAWGRAGSRDSYISDDVEFYYLHVMEGSVRLETSTGDAVLLGPGDTVVMPPFNFNPRVFEYTGDFEAMEFTTQGALDCIETSERRAGREPGPIATEGTIITRERPDSYLPGDGPRKFFSYRDLGAAKSTGGLIHIHVVGIVNGEDVPPAGTGWHTHSMDQVFFPFVGYLQIAVEGFGQVKMRRGDVMMIPAGLRHLVDAFTPDYYTTEICIPNDYLTSATPAP